MYSTHVCDFTEQSRSIHKQIYAYRSTSASDPLSTVCKRFGMCSWKITCNDLISLNIGNALGAIKIILEIQKRWKPSKPIHFLEPHCFSFPGGQEWETFGKLGEWASGSMYMTQMWRIRTSWLVSINVGNKNALIGVSPRCFHSDLQTVLGVLSD